MKFLYPKILRFIFNVRSLHQTNKEIESSSTLKESVEMFNKTEKFHLL